MSAKKSEREVPLRTLHFVKYQQDFLGVALRKNEYIAVEAERVIKALFKDKGCG